MKNRIIGGLALKELAKRVWQEAEKDHAFGRAAELAYYFLLALFPMLIFLTNMVGFLPDIQDNIIGAVAKVAPRQVVSIVREFLADVVENRSGGLISFGILGTLWASSNGVAAVIGALNAAFDANEERPYWKTRLVAIGLTISLSLMVVGGAALAMFARWLGSWVAGLLGLGSALTIVWKLLGYLGGLFLLLMGIQVIYYFGPNTKRRWKWITPGAVFAMGAFIIASELFSLYLRYGPGYSATYGSLGAVITLMVWLYLMGLLLIVGGEIDSEIQAARVPSV